MAVPDRDEPLPEPAARYQAAAATRAGTPFRSTRTHPPWRTHLAAALHPDTLLEQIPDSAHGPESRFQAREAVELAFIVGLQHLPPRQAAILLLRDVLSYSTAEVAAMLGTSDTGARVRLLPRRRRKPIWQLTGLLVLTVSGDRISAITRSSTRTCHDDSDSPKRWPIRRIAPCRVRSSRRCSEYGDRRPRPQELALP